MAEIRVTEHHNLGIEQAKERLGLFEDLLKKYKVKVSWSGFSARLKGPGSSGSIKLSTSSATVVLKLGLMAKAAGIDTKRLEASIIKRLKMAFSEEA